MDKTIKQEHLEFYKLAVCTTHIPSPHTSELVACIISLPIHNKYGRHECSCGCTCMWEVHILAACYLNMSKWSCSSRCSIAYRPLFDVRQAQYTEVIVARATAPLALLCMLHSSLVSMSCRWEGEVWLLTFMWTL